MKAAWKLLSHTSAQLGVAGRVRESLEGAAVVNGLLIPARKVTGFAWREHVSDLRALLLTPSVCFTAQSGSL